MTDPLSGIAIVAAGLGLLALLVGRPFGGWPRWHLQGRAFRIAGTYLLVGSLVVVALLMTRNDGFAFLTFALTALTLAAADQVVSRRRPAA